MRFYRNVTQTSLRGEKPDITRLCMCILYFSVQFTYPQVTFKIFKVFRQASRNTAVSVCTERDTGIFCMIIEYTFSDTKQCNVENRTAKAVVYLLSYYRAQFYSVLHLSAPPMLH